jgi:Spy/CpxP family protein refolding chaperone
MDSRKILSLGVGLGLLASLAAAQGPPLQERAKLRQNLITLRMLQMTQALDLSEDQAGKIFPFFNRIEKEKLESQKTMSADIVALRKLIRDPGAKEGDIAARLESLRAAQAALRAKDSELDKHLEAHLSTVQKARYLLFQIEFYRGLTDVLDRAGMRRGQMGGAPPVPVKK